MLTSCQRQRADKAHSKIIHLPRLTLQLVAELRVGDADQPARPLPDAAPAWLRHAVLGHDAIHDVLESRDGGAGMKPRDDAGDRFVSGGRVQHDKGLAVLGEERPAREVRLAARRGPVLAAQRLGGALAEEVDLEGGVDRDEALSPAMLRSSLVWSTGQNSTPGFSSTNSYSRVLPKAFAATTLFRWVRLLVPLITPFSIRSTNPSERSSELTP